MNIIAVASPLLPQPFIDALRTLGTVKVRDRDEDYLEGASVVVCSSLQVLDADTILAFPTSVKMVANAGVGYDHIALDALQARGIMLSNTPVVTEDTADLAMTLMLDVMRKASLADRRLRGGHWNYGLMGSRITGKTLGIVGFGNIGQAIAKRAKGFDMPVVYWGPRRKQALEANLNATWCETLEELLSRADIVSLNCPLNDDTRHIINSQTLNSIKNSAYLINTGRGPLIDEVALLEALHNNQIAGAGLDVFEHEPQVPEQLLNMDNVVITPHIGSATGECRMDIAHCVMANIQHFLMNGTPLNQV